jgi:hypothetical protein
MTQHLQLFTGRYANPNVAGSGLTPVGITRYRPRFRLPYELEMNLYDLAPTPTMLQIAKRENGRERFIAAYHARLDAIGVHEIVQQLTAAQGNASGVVLLCFEDLTIGENWCHRLLLGEWLRERAGLVVTELPDPGKKAARRKATPDP